MSTTADHFTTWSILRLAETGGLQGLPPAPSIPQSSHRPWGAYSSPTQHLTGMTAGLPLEIRLHLLEKGWIDCSSIDLHECVKSKSPRAVEHLKRYPDLLYRIISRPVSLPDLAWVRNTLQLNPNTGTHGRTLLSCMAHHIVRMDASAAGAIETLHTLGYKFTPADADILEKKLKGRTRHELLQALSWFEEQVGRTVGRPETVAAEIETAPQNAATLGVRQLDL